MIKNWIFAVETHSWMIGFMPITYRLQFCKRHTIFFAPSRFAVAAGVNTSSNQIESRTEMLSLIRAVIYYHLGGHDVPALISLSLISLPIMCKSLETA